MKNVKSRYNNIISDLFESIKSEFVCVLKLTLFGRERITSNFVFVVSIPNFVLVLAF